MLLKHSIIQPNSSYTSGYVWAGNGIFRSESRTEFRATVPHRLMNTPGLSKLSPGFELLVPKIPETKVKAIVQQINQYSNLEQLFYLYWKDNTWEVVRPEQRCTANSCISQERYPESAPIEIHSHGSMSAFFSDIDDQEESGCRVSSVIGRYDDKLEIVSRVCVHGLFLKVDSSQIYQNISNYCRVLF